MRIQLSFALLVATVFACSMHVAPAQAQRVFVGATGSDSNPCTFVAPCRSFQHAHDTTAAGGEIDVLDPAGYGALTITKAISIQGHGFSGITVASGGTGITINAPSTAAVTLNGLLIEGAGVGANGIVFNSGSSLTVTNCTAQNFVNGSGILIAPTSGTVDVVITNTIAANVAGGLGAGIRFASSGSAIINAVIDRVVATGNDYGIAASPNSSDLTAVAISNSVASNNHTTGIAGITILPGGLVVSIDNVIASGNAFGISYGGVARVVLGRSVITGNGTGIDNATSPNSFFTYKDNRITGNISVDIDSPMNSTVALQ
jgi:hypothetical protein